MKKYQLLANNKKARHEYFVEDTFEAGIVLTDTEIKSLRHGLSFEDIKKLSQIGSDKDDIIVTYDDVEKNILVGNGGNDKICATGERAHEVDER